MSNNLYIDTVTKTRHNQTERWIEVWDNYANGEVWTDDPFEEEPLALVRQLLTLAKEDGEQFVLDLLHAAHQNKMPVHVNGQTIGWEQLEPLFAKGSPAKSNPITEEQKRLVDYAFTFLLTNFDADIEDDLGMSEQEVRALGEAAGFLSDGAVPNNRLLEWIEIGESVGKEQGWAVFNTCRGWQVQKIDEDDVLTSDAEAIKLAKEAGILVDEDGYVLWRPEKAVSAGALGDGTKSREERLDKTPHAPDCPARCGGECLCVRNDMLQQVEAATCKRCGSPLTGYCSDITCPYSDHKQNETFTED